MKDTTLYQKILGIENPWHVTEVTLDMKKGRVDVYVDHADETTFACPKCGTDCPVYDHTQERTWRHLDTMQYKTILHCVPPRINCAEHGVIQASLPWAEPKSRFTKYFESLAIAMMQEASISGAAKILDITWNEAHGIQKRAVKRGLARKKDTAVRRIGIDEVAEKKGHNYLTIVTNLDEATVEHVAKDRKQESLDTYYESIGPERCAQLEAIGMDMWKPYIASTREHVPDADAKIVFDRFHIMRHVVEAVNEVRKIEHRLFLKEGDETLKGTRNMWLYSSENLPEKYREEFEELKQMHLKTGRAYALKEAIRDLWEYNRVGWAKRYWLWWYNWATHSRLKPMVKVARLLRRHIGKILSFIRLRVTTAMNEGVNGKIQMIKRRGYGYRNRENFKTAILFHCGGLSLHP